MRITSLMPRRLGGVGVGLLLAIVLAVVVVRAIGAAQLPADLEGSSKTADRDEAWPGQAIQYTVVISNSGDVTATAAAMTDTLPAGLVYESGSLTTTVTNGSTTGVGADNGVITWTGSLEAQGQATITFRAVLTGSFEAGDTIVNTAVITGTGSAISREATTTVVTSGENYLPAIFKPLPVPAKPTLDPIVRLSPANEWTVTWSTNSQNVTGYQVQEAPDATFTSATTYDVGTSLSLQRNPPGSFSQLLYCYRVRALIGDIVGDWSDTQCVYGNYRDDFDNPNSGWTIRRHDTDDSDNESYYQNSHFIVKIHGRWDYALASPLIGSPWDNYMINTSVRFGGGVDNLHSYAILFGADWNGQPCPNQDWDSCFNQYYRLNVIWFGSPDRLRVQLKRIEYHDDDNIGRGETLFGYRDIRVGDPGGYNHWTIEVRANGDISMYVNGDHFGTVNDTTFIDRPYFGVMAGDDEYLGSEPWFDWYEVSPILP